jgi:hypothetical protein
VATVGECLAAAGARPARTAADLRFARKAKAGQVGIALDGRTTYEFLPAAGGGRRAGARGGRRSAAPRRRLCRRRAGVSGGLPRRLPQPSLRAALPQ